MRRERGVGRRGGSVLRESAHREDDECDEQCEHDERDERARGPRIERRSEPGGDRRRAFAHGRHEAVIDADIAHAAPRLVLRPHEPRAVSHDRGERGDRCATDAVAQIRATRECPEHRGAYE